MTIFSSSFQRSFLAFLKTSFMFRRTIKICLNLHYHFVYLEVVLVVMSVMLEMVARFVFLDWSMKFAMNLKIN